MKEEPPASFHNLIVPVRVIRNAYALPKKSDDVNGTCIELSSHLLQFPGTNASIVKAVSRTGQLLNLTNLLVAQFADTIRLTSVRYSNIYFVEHNKDAFTNCQPFTARSEVHKFRGCE